VVYADDVNLLSDNVDTSKKDTGTLTDVIKEVGLEVNAEKNTYILLSLYQNAGKIHDIKIDSRCIVKWHNSNFFWEREQ
jgi:hypothetical protein